jgi:hypothetical protein
MTPLDRAIIEVRVIKLELSIMAHIFAIWTFAIGALGTWYARQEWDAPWLGFVLAMAVNFFLYREVIRPIERAYADAKQDLEMLVALPREEDDHLPSPSDKP